MNALREITDAVAMHTAPTSLAVINAGVNVATVEMESSAKVDCIHECFKIEIFYSTKSYLIFSSGLLL